MRKCALTVRKVDVAIIVTGQCLAICYILNIYLWHITEKKKTFEDSYQDLWHSLKSTHCARAEGKALASDGLLAAQSCGGTAVNSQGCGQRAWPIFRGWTWLEGLGHQHRLMNHKDFVRSHTIISYGAQQTRCYELLYLLKGEIDTYIFSGLGQFCCWQYANLTWSLHTAFRHK